MEASIVQQQLLARVKPALQFLGFTNTAAKVFGGRAKFRFQFFFKVIQSVVFNCGIGGSSKGCNFYEEIEISLTRDRVGIL